MRSLLLASAAAGVLFANSAQADVLVLQDDFSSSTAQANWPGDSIFQSIPQPGYVQGQPSVDLVGTGYYPTLDFNGQNAVDLDGTTGSGNNPTGELQSVKSLSQGDYAVSFYLAGNLRGAPAQTTVITIGGQSFNLTPSNAQGYTLETLYFFGVSGFLSFLDLGPSDQQGNLLADIQVDAIPLPATWTMALIGLAGLGFVGYRNRRQKDMAAVA